jgi:tetratricopeptide (TPR) repeat protein
MRAEDALDRLEALAASRPGDPLPTARLAAASAQVGDFDKASEALRKTRTRLEACLRLGMPELARQVADLLRAEMTGLEPLLLRLEIALHLEARPDVDELVDALQKMTWPSLDARIQAATLTLASGRHREARALIEPRAHDQASAHILFVHTLIGCGEVDAAAREAREALALWCDAEIEREGLMRGAKARPSRETDRVRVDLQVLVGVAELQARRVDAAIAALSEALRLAPERPETYYNLGLALIEAGSPATAAGIIEAGLELAPQDARLAALQARVTGR